VATFNHYFGGGIPVEVHAVDHPKLLSVRDVPSLNPSVERTQWRGFVGDDKVASNRFLDIEVEVNVTVLDDSPLTYWAINAVSREEDVDLSDIAFPIISGLTKIAENPEDDYLAYPALTGLLLRNPLEKMSVDPGIPWQLPGTEDLFEEFKSRKGVP